MRILSAIIGLLVLLAVAAFCLFGFLATFEPSDTPGEFLAFRIGYSVVEVGSLVSTGFLIVNSLRK